MKAEGTTEKAQATTAIAVDVECYFKALFNHLNDRKFKKLLHCFQETKNGVNLFMSI